MRPIFFVYLASCIAAVLPAPAADDKRESTPPLDTEPAKVDNPKGKADADGDAPPTKPSPAPKPAPPSPSSPIGSREHPQIVRTAVPRLVYQTDKDHVVERSETDISSAIVVGFGNDLAIAWDTRECRWLYAWRGGFIERIEGDGKDSNSSESTTEIVGELVYLSTSPAPLSVAMGAAGGPRYYGYRMVDGIPEFLYTIGKLKVTERISPSEDGASIVQKFSVERHPVDLILAAPRSANRSADDKEKDSKATVTVTNGSLKGDYIYVDSKKAGDFTLSHRIGDPLPRSGAAKPGPVARPVVIPLLTLTNTETSRTDSMPAPKFRQKPEAAPEPTPTPEPAPTPKPKSDTPPKPNMEPKPAPALTPDPTPAPPEKSGPIITSAQRYDRDILLTDPHIETSSLKPESTAFADRDFKFTQLPDEVIGADHVRTFDRDKYIPGDILSYQIELESDATVWLMFDKRVKPLPKWIGENFTNTGQIAVLDSGESFQVLRADIDAGKIRLGPQDSGAGAHFYLIAASPRSADAPKQKPKGKRKKSEERPKSE